MAGTRADVIAWPERGQMRLERTRWTRERVDMMRAPPARVATWSGRSRCVLAGAGHGRRWTNPDGGPGAIAKAKEPVTRAILQAAVDRAFSPADIDHIGRIVVVVVVLSALVLAQAGHKSCTSTSGGC